MTKKRILYVVPPTGKFAGIERVVDEIADALSLDFGDRFDISVLHLSDYGDYTVGPRHYTCLQGFIRRKNAVYKEGPAHGRLHRMLVLRRMIGHGNYDLVVVPQVEPVTIVWFACLGLKPRLVVYLHGNHQREQERIKSRVVFGLFRLLVLDRLAYIFGVSPKQIATFRKDYPSRVPDQWTPNPVRKFPSAERLPCHKEGVVFVNVGRFCYQKGQDLIIEAFAKVVQLKPKAKLALVGYGDEKRELEAKVEELGIAASVSFEHHPQDPVRPLLAADVYVSLSRWDGWSLAIGEALRVGLPVVSSDCDFGPSDILVDDRLGRLVPAGNNSAAVEMMVYYYDNIVAERAFADFRKSYIARFDVGTVTAEHAVALAKAVERPSS